MKTLIAAMLCVASLANATPAHDSLVQLADRIAHEQGVDPALLKAVCDVESSWRSRVVGDHGRSIGLCQVRVDTAKTFLPKVRPTRLRQALFNPTVNLTVAAKLLRLYIQRFGSESLALVAYNAGPNFSSLSYVQKVSAAKAKYN